MDPVPVLSTTILIATIATIVLGVLTYSAYKLRDRRRPETDEEPVYFRRYFPGEQDAED